MSTDVLFQELGEEDLFAALSEVLLPQLEERLSARALGHCMRVANLDFALMLTLCRALRKNCPNAQIYILGENGTAPEQDKLFISSTKLVELRNPLPDGSLRPPLLVFLPANLHASAEDSFGIATFEDIPVTDIYRDLLDLLAQRIPTPLQGYIHDLFTILSSAWWPWADDVARVRFLLTALKNQIDGESLGASLYELGLVPDFHLFKDPPLMQNRIQRNLESMRILTYSDASPRGRVLELGLSNKTVQRGLINFLAAFGVVDPHIWTRQIVINKQNWDISFDKWKFLEEINKDKIAINVLSLSLPEVKEDEADERLEGLSGQRVLNPNQVPHFSVTFRIEPSPARVSSLDHFTVQILTRNGEPVGGAKRVSVHTWGPKKQEHTVHLDKLNRLDFEDGWHIVRVLPWTEEEDLVPLDTTTYDPGVDRMRTHESEAFYVLCDEGELVDPPQRAVPFEYSREHALLRGQFRACTEQQDPQTVQITQVEWLKKSNKARQYQEILEVKLSRGGKYHIQISTYLKELEQRILTSPRSPVNWRWELRLGNGNQPQPTSDEWPRSTAIESFLAAREKYFVVLSASTNEALTQAADLTAARPACLEYVEAYRDLLKDLAQKVIQSRGSDQQKAIQTLRMALTLDTVHIMLTDIRGHVKEAAIVGPTHPLRALWFATWTRLGQEWLTAVQEGPGEYIVPTRESLLRSLAPYNIPATLPCLDGRIFLVVDNLTPFWSLYAPPGEADTHGLLGELCSALGLPEPSMSGETITPEVLAKRVSRYLVQHPYIRTLNINAFNPGHATMLAQVLLLLQKEEIFASLRYDLRLFVPDPSAPRVGEALEVLLTPNTSSSTEISDAFSIPGRSHLFPKLSLAVHALEAFYASPQAYRAHVSLLFDLFPAEEVAAGTPFASEDRSLVYGLVQDFATQFNDDEDGTIWRRQPRHGKVQPLVNGDDAVEEPATLLAEMEQLLSGMIATVATGIVAFEQRPIVTLSLRTDQRELIHNVHEVSDWVITLDRNLGIEFFDHGGQANRPDYLIDFTPGVSPGSGHQLIITSRTMLELESTLVPFLARYNLSQERHILEQLRLLSGRLALKLISAPTQQMEALGLALARLFLLQQGALSNQLILPLDVHLDLFLSTKQMGEEIGEATTLQRTDLALFDLDAIKRTIRCNLVEVKCYNRVGTTSDYGRLKENIAEQINMSEGVLRRHFDPQYKWPDRPDRLLKTRELLILLEFYLGRSQRYGMLQPEAEAEARFFITTLEAGYSLEFSRSAITFDLSQQGLSMETEQGIEFYRVGRDQVEALLLESAPAESAQQERAKPPSVSRLPSAAFLVPERPRFASRDQMVQPVVVRKLTEERQGWEMPEMMEGDNDKPEEEYMPSSPEAREEGEDRHKAVAVGETPPTATSEKSAREDQRVDSGEVSQHALQAESAGEALTVPYAIILGVQGKSPQYGLLGEISGRKVALDLNQTHTISLFGVQGSGKSYTLGSIIEMACLSIPNVNVLPNPLATVVFHFSPTQDYKPEFTSMVDVNSDERQIEQLRERYGAAPRSLRDVVLLVPAAKLAERQREYPQMQVVPLTFAAAELKAVHWKFLMGAVGSSSMYIRQINLIMKKLRERLTLDGLRSEVEQSSMSDHLKELASMRLQFASEYIDDQQRLTDIIRPGRLIIVDIRDEFIEKDEALGLFVVLLQIFSEATYQGQTFNKLVVFDEAHKYMESQDLVGGLIEVVREMRHKGTSILVASQDPPSVPISLIELSSQIILHRCNSPAWLKHIQKANSALNNLTPERMSHLGAGEAYVWSSKASDEGFSRGAVKIHCRPRVTRHGGDTKTAVAKKL